MTGEVKDSGSYQLVIRLAEERTMVIGRRGRFAFPPGYYVYTGRAVRGLESRIARHLRRNKKMRWHIDYLLRHGSAIEVRRYLGDLSECSLSRTVEALPGSRVVVRMFGSSDCRCSAHLFHFRQNPSRELDDLYPHCQSSELGPRRSVRET
ncbi:MAG TPA: GIY-YIG nuclease family protein [Nitrososphaerales archaeon]|nr:GIY-YIG nuclease family protein [Nitrososphaerales archaeon]